MANETEGFVDRGGEGRMAAGLSQRRANNQTNHSERNRGDNSPSVNVYWKYPKTFRGMQCS